jgi:hypothetical protein
MRIIPFSTKSILIHSAIYSNNLLLGSTAKKNSTVLKDLLHSTTKSIIYPSFTQSNKKLMALAHLLSTNFIRFTASWSQNNGSWDCHIELIFVYLFTYLCSKQRISTNKISCKYEYMYLCFNILRLICESFVSHHANLSSFLQIHYSISFLEGFHVMSLLHHVAQNIQVLEMKPIVGSGFQT